MFNDRLRATRMFRGITQQKTADAMGVSLRHYQNTKAEKLNPTLWDYPKLQIFLMYLQIFYWDGMTI